MHANVHHIGLIAIQKPLISAPSTTSAVLSACMSRAWLCIGALVAGVLTAAVADARDSSQTPETILAALSRPTISASELPAGLRVHSVNSEPLTGTQREHHALGAVSLDFGPLESMTYTVFPTRADAMAQYRDETSRDNAEAVGHKAATFLDTPLDVVNVVFGFGSQSNGVTAVLFVRGDVVGKALVSSPPTTSKASPFPALAPIAEKVATFGFNHLFSVLNNGRLALTPSARLY
jgi:hypothetical protein